MKSRLLLPRLNIGNPDFVDTPFAPARTAIIPHYLRSDRCDCSKDLLQNLNNWKEKWIYFAVIWSLRFYVIVSVSNFCLPPLCDYFDCHKNLHFPDRKPYRKCCFRFYCSVFADSPDAHLTGAMKNQMFAPGFFVYRVRAKARNSIFAMLFRPPD